MGMTGMGGTQSRTPATFSINATAADGAEVSSMLRDIMNLAGVKPVSDLPAFGGSKEIEIEPVHALEPMDGGQSAGDEMSDLIGMVDRMNGDDDMSAAQGDVDGDGDHDMDDHDAEKDSPVSKMADDVRDMTNTLKDEGIGAGFDSATTTPNETPANTPTGDKNNNKPKTAFTGAGNNNLANESTVESVAAQLLKDYQAFVNEGKVNELSKDTLKSYNDKATNDIAKRITGDDKDLKKIGDRQKGYERASKRGVK
jgi:hypothetical protein